jgi:hypothetical protein
VSSRKKYPVELRGQAVWMFTNELIADSGSTGESRQRLQAKPDTAPANHESVQTNPDVTPLPNRLGSEHRFRTVGTDVPTVLLGSVMLNSPGLISP